MYGQEALPKSINSLSVVKFVSTVMNHRNVLSVVFYRYICFFIFNSWLKIDLPVGHEINVHFHGQPPVWDGRHLRNPPSLNMLTIRCSLCTGLIHHVSISPVASGFVHVPDFSKVSTHLEWALVQTSLDCVCCQVHSRYCWKTLCLLCYIFYLIHLSSLQPAETHLPRLWDLKFFCTVQTQWMWSQCSTSFPLSSMVPGAWGHAGSVAAGQWVMVFKKGNSG